MAAGDKLPVVMQQLVGVPGGVARLGSDGKIPKEELRQTYAEDVQLPDGGNVEMALADMAAAIRTMIVDGYLPIRRVQEQHEAEIKGESHTVTLTNSKSYPFNSTVSSPVSVPLTTNRKNLYYSIEAEATSVEGGLVGDIHITDKQLNGFKVSFDGSAKRVTLTIRIKGGMAS